MVGVCWVHVPPKPLMGDVWFGVSKVCCMPSFTSAQINTSLACQPCSWSWGDLKASWRAPWWQQQPLPRFYHWWIFYCWYLFPVHIHIISYPVMISASQPGWDGGIMWYQPSADQLTQKLPRSRADEPLRESHLWDAHCWPVGPRGSATCVGDVPLGGVFGRSRGVLSSTWGEMSVTRWRRKNWKDQNHKTTRHH